jgi:large subunit ribosomal protein L19
MPTNIENILQPQLKKIPDIQSGDTVRVHQRIIEGEKQRVQVFEGIVIAKKHGKGINGTITVRRVQKGYGVERVFPIHSPIIEKFEIVKRAKVRQAKLYYLRKAKGKKGRLKARALGLQVEEPAQTPEPQPEPMPEAPEEKPAEESVDTKSQQPASEEKTSPQKEDKKD